MLEPFKNWVKDLVLKADSPVLLRIVDPLHLWTVLVISIPEHRKLSSESSRALTSRSSQQDIFARVLIVDLENRTSNVLGRESTGEVYMNPNCVLVSSISVA